MNKEELIIGFFEKGYCCNLDEVKNTCLGLLKENQELKKQVEQYKGSQIANYNQQKEFIEYLEDIIKQNEIVVEVSKYGLPKNCSKLLIDFYKVILSKYKEIIGVSDDSKAKV